MELKCSHTDHVCHIKLSVDHNHSDIIGGIAADVEGKGGHPGERDCRILCSKVEITDSS